MEYFIGIITILSFVPVICDAAFGRSRRAIPQMCGMMYCTTNRKCLDFNFYGCWCGRGGAGSPVDSIDRCCMHHDLCFDRLTAQGHQCSTYWGWYSWDCVEGRPLCTGTENSCHDKLCQCDLQFSLCLRNHTYPEKKPNCKIDGVVTNRRQWNNYDYYTFPDTNPGGSVPASPFKTEDELKILSRGGEPESNYPSPLQVATRPSPKLIETTTPIYCQKCKSADWMALGVTGTAECFWADLKCRFGFQCC